MSEFMEIIEWFDSTGEQIVHRYPPEGSAEIKFGAQLVIRENQAAGPWYFSPHLRSFQRGYLWHFSGWRP